MGILGLWFHSDVWITVGPIMVINIVLFASLLTYFATGRSKRRDIHEAARRSRSKFLSVDLKEWWVWNTDPVAKLFVKLHMSPNFITMIGFLLAVVAGLLFAKGLFGYAGWAMIFGATFDIFDGRVARLTGKVTRSGAYFDAVMDRFGEGVCFIGLAYYFRESWLLPFVIAGLIGSTMVSYTKAFAGSYGIDCKVGSMQRPERIVYTGVASIFTPALTILLQRWWADPLPVLVIGAVIIIAVMTNATAIYRMVYSMTALDDADKRDIESIPQLLTKLGTSEGRTALWEKARYGYDRSKAKFSHVVLFMLDGVQKHVLEELVDAGDLPNLAQHLQQRGGRTRAISAFPSTTGPAAAPFVTGCFPGTCGVPGVTWFDRTIPEGRLLTMNRFRDYLGWGAYAMDHDLSHTVRTIFEYSRRATNIFGMMNRGCGLSRDPAFFRLYSMFRRAKVATDFGAVFDAANLWFAEAIQRDADCIYYTLPPVDFVPEGESAYRALESYRRFDDAIGRAAEQLKEQGIYDSTALIFAGVHGRTERKSVYDFNGFLKDRYHLFTHPGKPREWLEAEAIAAPSGTSMAHLYLRRDGSWNDQSFFEEIERRGLVGALLERREVDVLAGRSAEGGVIIASRRGRAHVVEDPDGRITYLVKGGDPFGYGAMAQVMKADDVLGQTADSDYPDGIVQIMQLFRSQRSGDLVISADPGCAIADAGSAATHGSLHRGHLEVPLIASTPLAEGPVRTTDVFALVLDLLGIEATHDVDGYAISAVTDKRVDSAAV